LNEVQDATMSRERCGGRMGGKKKVAVCANVWRLLTGVKSGADGRKVEGLKVVCGAQLLVS